MENIIYGYIDPRNGQLRYVGRSSWGLHRAKDFYRHTGHCKNWVYLLKSIGLKPEIVILEKLFDNITNEDLNNAEIWHIAYWKSLGFSLTNLTEGGGGLKGKRHTAETKKKISVANKGSKRTPEEREKISQAMRGRKLSEEHKIKVSKGLMGHKNSKETKLKMSKAASNRMVPIKDQFGNIYPSLTEAAKKIGVNVGYIYRVLKGERNHAKGFTFTQVLENTNGE